MTLFSALVLLSALAPGGALKVLLPNSFDFNTTDMDLDEDCRNHSNYKCYKKGGHSVKKHPGTSEQAGTSGTPESVTIMACTDGTEAQASHCECTTDGLNTVVVNSPSASRNCAAGEVCMVNQPVAQACLPICDNLAGTPTVAPCACGSATCNSVSSVCASVANTCPLPVSVTIIMTNAEWAVEVGWSLAGPLGHCGGTAAELAYQNYQVYEPSCNLVPGTYTLTCTDTLSDGWHGATISINGVSYCGDQNQWGEQPHTIIIS